MSFIVQQHINEGREHLNFSLWDRYAASEEAGEAAFIEMWEVMGGQERFDRRRRWWADARVGFERACSR